MYLHIGGEFVVRRKEVVGIMDIENTSISKITRDYLAGAEKNGRVINVSDDLPKSFVITKGEDGVKVYISPISSVTLSRRKNNFV